MNYTAVIKADIQIDSGRGANSLDNFATPTSEIYDPRTD